MSVNSNNAVNAPERDPTINAQKTLPNGFDQASSDSPPCDNNSRFENDSDFGFEIPNFESSNCVICCDVETETSSDTGSN